MTTCPHCSHLWVVHAHGCHAPGCICSLDMMVRKVTSVYAVEVSVEHYPTTPCPELVDVEDTLRRRLTGVAVGRGGHQSWPERLITGVDVRMVETR